MSAETLTIVISAATMVLAFFGVIGWLVTRMDAQFKNLEQRLTTRIDASDERLINRIDAVEDKLTNRIDAVERELVEVKVGLARLEGPPRRLLSAR